MRRPKYDWQIKLGRKWYGFWWDYVIFGKTSPTPAWLRKWLLDRKWFGGNHYAYFVIYWTKNEHKRTMEAIAKARAEGRLKTIYLDKDGKRIEKPE